jgi:hypothetical protein
VYIREWKSEVARELQLMNVELINAVNSTKLSLTQVSCIESGAQTKIQVQA